LDTSETPEQRLARLLMAQGGEGDPWQRGVEAANQAGTMMPTPPDPRASTMLMGMGRAGDDIRKNAPLLADTGPGRIAQALVRVSTGQTPIPPHGMRREDYSDDPNAPQPIGPLVNDAMNVADVMSMGSLPAVAMRGAQRGALGIGIPPKMEGTGVPKSPPHNDNPIPIENLSERLRLALENNPTAKEPFLRPLDKARLEQAQKRSDQSMAEAQFQLGPNPTREEFEKWALRSFSAPPKESAMDILRGVAHDTTQEGTKKLLGLDRPPPSRTHSEYIAQKGGPVTGENLLGNEALWAAARDLAAQKNMTFSQAFTGLARRSMGRELTPEELASVMSAGAQHDLLTPRKLYD
jgi:hypothetical protein